MKKILIAGAISVVAVMCVGFTAVAAQREITSKPMPENVQEEYLIPEINDNGKVVYKTDEFEATVVEDTDMKLDAAAKQNGDPVAATMTAVDLPDDIEEEYLYPIKVDDGVYEYRDADGNMIATMHEYESLEALQAAQAHAKKDEIVYDIDMDVPSKSEAYGSENIDIREYVNIVYTIDFARKTPSYLGKYVAKHGKVSWFSPGSNNGFYKSINITGSGEISVAIKNDGVKDNIYTGTVKVSLA